MLLYFKNILSFQRKNYGQTYCQSYYCHPVVEQDEEEINRACRIINYINQHLLSGRPLTKTVPAYVCLSDSASGWLKNPYSETRQCIGWVHCPQSFSNKKLPSVFCRWAVLNAPAASGPGINWCKNNCIPPFSRRVRQQWAFESLWHHTVLNFSLSDHDRKK